MKEKYIDSSSRRDRLHLYIWMPKDQPKPGVIVQMTHGMVEHMGRYEELARYLNAHGIGAIGEFGKGVRRVCDRYRRAGIRDVSMKLYPGMRHELLHETERKMVQKDILNWIEAHFEQE